MGVKVQSDLHVCKFFFTNMQFQTPLFRYSPGDIPITFLNTREK